MTAVITATAIDREAGTMTITLGTKQARLDKFVRRHLWDPETLYMHSEVYRQLRSAMRETLLYGEYSFRAGDFERDLRGVRYDIERATDQMLALRRPRPITPAIVVTLATLGAFEWLRHRKAEVAAAEASGDYTTLIQEFVTWLRALLAAWRKAAE